MVFWNSFWRIKRPTNNISSICKKNQTAIWSKRNLELHDSFLFQERDGNVSRHSVGSDREKQSPSAPECFSFLYIQVSMLDSERKGTSQWLAAFISQCLLPATEILLEGTHVSWGQRPLLVTLCQQLQNWQQWKTKTYSKDRTGREPLRNPAYWVSGSWCLWSLLEHQGQGLALGVFPFFTSKVSLCFQ